MAVSFEVVSEDRPSEQEPHGFPVFQGPVESGWSCLTVWATRTDTVCTYLKCPWRVCTQAWESIVYVMCVTCHSIKSHV